MLIIDCPFCGPREETEFVCGGEAQRRRPLNPGVLTDGEWCDYLYNSDNHKGWMREWWWHLYGCESWFEIERHTVTHDIRRSQESTSS